MSWSRNAIKTLPEGNCNGKLLSTSWALEGFRVASPRACQLAPLFVERKTVMALFPEGKVVSETMRELSLSLAARG